MGAEKGYGPDGLTGAFYYAFWDLVGGDIMELVKKFVEDGCLDGNINSTNICLIPKKFHPIV